MLSGRIATFCVGVHLTPPDSLHAEIIFKIFTVGMHSDIFKQRRIFFLNTYRHVDKASIQIVESCTENQVCNNLVDHNGFTS